MNKATFNQFTRRLRTAILPVSTITHRSLTYLGKALSLPLGTIFFIPHPWISLLLWGALLQNPRYAAFALLGLVIGTSVGKLLRAGDAIKLGGGLKANALLAAVMVAWLTSVTELSIEAQLSIAAAASIASAILSAAIMHLLKDTLLPSLVWGYSIIAIMLFSLCSTCTLSASSMMPTLPMPDDAISWGETFVRSLGYLIYSPSYEAGFLMGFAILLWSRILFLTGLVGWLSGVGIALLLENLGLTYYWLPTSYNYFITGMALGSVYFLPSRGALLLAVVGGCGASFLGLVLQYIFQGSSIAYLPITAAATIWIVMGAVTFADDSGVAKLNNTPHLCPEEAWWIMAYWAQRFGYKEVLFSIPVAGALRIAQGFNSTLSHTGDWRHALDFLRPITIDNSSDSSVNIWAAPVYSPASGFIERIQNTIPDNPLGVSNYAENWGNHIVIRLDQGGWALLAHLQQNSIVLATGMRIEAGDYIGKVGSSGRSPRPHLHIQAQSGSVLGAPTIPFRLVNYLSSLDDNTIFSRWNAAALPAEGEMVMAAYPNQRVHDLLAGIGSGSAVWSIETKGYIPSSFRHAHSKKITRINTTLDSAGRHRFNSNFEKGTLIAILASDAWRIVEAKQLASPLLKLFALAIPSIPYAVKPGVTWCDPVVLIPAGYTSWLSLSLAPYFNRPFTLSKCQCLSEPSEKEGRLQIETTLEHSHSSFPLKITCQIEVVRGPVRIQADFENGSVVYSMLSFELNAPHSEE